VKLSQTNVSKQTCTLTGYPGVSYRDSNDTQVGSAAEHNSLRAALAAVSGGSRNDNSVGAPRGLGCQSPPRRPPVSLRCLPVQAKRDRAAGGIRPRHNSRAETPASAKRRRRVRKLAAKHVSEETGIEVNFTVLPESEVRQEISQYRDGRVTRPHPFPW